MSDRTAKKERREQRRRRRKATRAIRAAADPGPLKLVSDGEVKILAAGTGEGESENGRFSIVAYTGGKMRPAGYAYPVVADLKKMKVYAGSLPIHLYHDQSRPVGHAEVAIGKSVRLEGEFSVPGADAEMLRASGAKTFPWKASVGLAPEEPLKFYDKGETFHANGRSFSGPAYYAGRTTLFETSFVTVAGDPQTRVRIAANHDSEASMPTFDEYLIEAGFEADELTETQRDRLEAAYKAEHPPEKPAPKSRDKSDLPPELVAGFDPKDAIKAMREHAAAEMKRHNEIAAIKAEYGDVKIEVDGESRDLYAHAIEAGMNTTDVELHALRNSRREAPAIHAHGGLYEECSKDILAAAAAKRVGMLDDKALVAHYGEQTMNRCEQYLGMGLRDIAAAACDLEGKPRPRFWGDGRQTMKAAFTTETLPYIFENVMNKSLLPAFERAARYAQTLCRVKSANDFKQISRTRLLGTGAWERVGPDGELKHGAISDEKFTAQIETYGQYLLLTRQDFINDDLGALEDLATYMALMGAQVVDDAFFTLLLANPNNFIHSNNANLGSTGAFGLASLSALKTLFRKQKRGPSRGGTKRAEDQFQINNNPVHLVVPVEIEDNVNSFIGSSNLMMENRDTAATAASKTGPKNPHYGMYQTHAPQQLSDTRFTGNSATAFYLFGDNPIASAFCLTFLNGVQTPTVERVESVPYQLGMGFRGYLDFGVDQQDPQGVAKEPGT